MFERSSHHYRPRPPNLSILLFQSTVINIVFDFIIILKFRIVLFELFVHYRIVIMIVPVCSYYY